MGALRHCFGEALKALWRRPVTTFFTVTSIAFSLFLAGVVWLAGLSLDRVSSSWARGVVVSVYLRDDVETAQKQRLVRSLKALPGFHSMTHVDKKNALTRLKKNLGGDAALLKDVEAGWLPESFEITLKGKRDVLLRAQERLLSLGTALPAVEEVRTLHKWHRRLDGLAETLTTSAGVLLTITMVVCVFLVTATVRLGLLSRRKEIETQRILGATRNFVSAPILLEGVFLALLGCLFASIFLYTMYLVTVDRIPALLGMGIKEGLPGFLPPSTILGAFCLTALVGLFGGRLAVGRGVQDE